MATLRVLVVDDEPGMRLGMKRTLERYRLPMPELGEEAGFTVEEAGAAEDALEVIRAAPPDLMLLDYKLPGMNGLELLEQVGEPAEKFLTIMMTAYASLDTAVTAIKRGAHDFLAKPFTPAELKSTVRKAAEGVIHARKARELAEERRRVRFEFISVVAHELKAPLAAIEGYLGIIRDRAAGEDLASYDHMIERSMVRTEQMRKLILDLLDLTRIESGRKKRTLETIDLRRPAEASIETVAPAADERDITVQLDAEGPVEIEADRGEMEIIFNNLVSNAVKYNRDGGRVEVTLARKDGQAVVTVSDTGIGMTEEESDKLFNDFVRIKNAKTRGTVGSGLGLSIVKKLTAMYGGAVHVDSTPDVGSTFTVTLNHDARGDAETQETAGQQS